jgi:hypothetical protein
MFAAGRVEIDTDNPRVVRLRPAPEGPGSGE